MIRHHLIQLVAIAIVSILIPSIKADASTNIDSNLQSIYELSPESVRKTFEENKWDIEVVNSDQLSGLYGSRLGDTEGHTLAGVTVYEISTIYLSDKENFSDMALNHEMGHYFDYNYYQLTGVLPSKSTQFSYVYTQEAYISDLFEEYTISTPSEYFAQAFKLYCEEKDKLGAYYPLTYKFIDDLVKDYDGMVNDGMQPIYNDQSVITANNLATDLKQRYNPYDNNTVSIPYEESVRKITIKYVP